MTPITLVAALICAQVRPAGGGVLDHGVLVVRRDSQEVARETFRLIERRPGGGAAGRGWLLEATARWSAAPSATYAPLVELGADSALVALTYTVAANGITQRITGQPAAGRITLRFLSPGVERVREIPADRRVVPVDDSVFSMYLVAAWRAGDAPTAVHAVYPRLGRRVALTVRDLGMVATMLNRDPATLRDILVAGGPDGPVHVWLDSAGRMMKVDVPDRGLRAERLPV
jgi:hypothetical protein